jgi:hypothetical protein
VILSLILGYSLENLLLKIKITLNVKNCFLGIKQMASGAKKS